MGSLRRFNVKKLISDTGITHFVETGTGQGKSLKMAYESGFENLDSCECNDTLHTAAERAFADAPHVRLYKGRSKDFIEQYKLRGKALFFLDAHYYGGADFGFELRKNVMDHPDSFPLCDELAFLLQKPGIANSVIIIDDARIYYEEDFQEGKCPPELMRKHDLPVLQLLLGKFSSLYGMQVKISHHDQGYILIYPESLPSFDPYLNILKYDTNSKGTIRQGICGVTGLALQRRLRDSRFATTYLRGDCIDIGGGNDPLDNYRQFFPLLSNSYTYDLASGDGQKLENVPDNEFDCLYSSHCLEHLADCREGLKNWIRVVRPGGFLVISVPDEDLYEQGVWPSLHARDYHIWSFTIQKDTSWSPVSVNLLEELHKLSDCVKVHKIELVDGAFHQGMRQTLDQTMLPYGECTIEMILQKK